MKKKIIFWILTVVITLFTAVYQRTTGPTYPKSFKLSLDGSEHKFSLPRSQNGFTDCQVKINLADPTITGKVVYRRYPTSEPWDTLNFNREGESLIAWLPKQPAAGKLEYKVELFQNGSVLDIPGNEAVTVRFKDNVPAYVLIPHILFIFTAMLLSTLAAFFAMGNIPSYKFYVGLTLLFFILGGMIFGPIVQKFAFGEFWTGFPYGKDLTDNKSLIGFLAWTIAWVGNRKKDRKYLVVIAAIVVLAISYIPHSARGSELDYKSGDIKTGMIHIP
ncbi:MAG: hypothetical protein H6538_04995 [Bacteroidales bacterium]|nr:hypothetical protein [Bacteroidales bacterium]MCB8998866.1 hypothetical protein [Bacteroidales bacterium]MCB9013995.1 hypothetical protein [Bacteroidales bacterium]